MYAQLLELTALMSFWLCLGAWQEEGAASGRRAFVGLSLGVFAWTVGVLARVEGIVTVAQAQRIAMVGAIPIPALWLSLGLLAANHSMVRWRRYLPSLLTAPQLVLYASLYSDFAPGFFLSAQGDHTVLGIGGWVNAVYSWALAIYGSWLFLVGARRLLAQRVPRLLVCLASTAPVLGSMIMLITGRDDVDPTPILICLALLPLRFALFSGGWLHVLALPEHAIVRHIPRPLVFTDRDGVVAGLNPAAQALLRMSPDDALGRALDAVLAEAAPRSRCARWPIAVGGSVAGHAVLLEMPPERSSA
ncbi:MAG TPA: histidine kinase N-terminal 7TM domain-containing protein [Myxococcota bacterium]|nr:histidine kinase N-terminal 7TM domain-containing protein [Myxococcota bacterium]